MPKNRLRGAGVIWQCIPVWMGYWRLDMMPVGILSEYIPASWFHPLGIHKGLKRFWHRLPDVSGKLFLTLTIDPLNFSGPESAFDYSRKRIRKVFYRLRRGVKWEGKIYKVKCPYAVKLEFHENGWPHFHIVFLTKRFLPPELVSYLWGLGWTDVRRIRSDEFHYLLKYVTKAQSLPDWVLKKSRIRVFQTSRGFLLPEEKPVQAESQETEKDLPPKRQSSTLGERLAKWDCMAKLVSPAGTVWQVSFKVSFIKVLGELVVEIARQGRYLGGRKIVINDRKELIPWVMKAAQLSHSRGFS